MQEKSTIALNIFSIASSLILFALFLVSLLISDSIAKDPMLFAILFCVSASTLFAFIWPVKSWRWGLWIGSSFWAFLGLVFISYMLNQQLVWTPVLEALAITVLSCFGALVGQRLNHLLKGNTDNNHERNT